MKHKRKRNRGVTRDLSTICAWCLRTIPEEHERFGLGAKALPGLDFSEVEGTMIEIELVSVGKTVPVVVTTPDSPVRKQDGFHLYFMVCSEDCGRNLQAAVKDDVQLGRSLGLHP